MNIALTGSSGLLGSRLLKDLKNLNHNYFCISSSASSPNNNIYSYEEMLTAKIPHSVDCMIHLASQNSERSESDISADLEITNNVIKGMKTLNCKKLIFFSTSKVYGDNSFDYQLFEETSPLNPACSYGKAKAACEEQIIKAAQNSNFEYIILRMSPVLINDPRSSVGKLHTFIAQGFPVPSFAAGDKNFRSFLSYKLLFRVLESMIAMEFHHSNEIFNLTNNKAISTNELFEDIALSMQKNLKIIRFPNFLFQAMLRVNRLQLILCRLFGNSCMSNAKLTRIIDLTMDGK